MVVVVPFRGRSPVSMLGLASEHVKRSQLMCKGTAVHLRISLSLHLLRIHGHIISKSLKRTWKPTVARTVPPNLFRRLFKISWPKQTAVGHVDWTSCTTSRATLPSGPCFGGQPVRPSLPFWCHCTFVCLHSCRAFPCNCVHTHTHLLAHAHRDWRSRANASTPKWSS